MDILIEKIQVILDKKRDEEQWPVDLQHYYIYQKGGLGQLWFGGSHTTRRNYSLLG